MVIKDRFNLKIASFIILPILLILPFFYTARILWQGTAELHTILETIATALAIFVGATTLVRFYSRKNNTFLFLGSGFLGTAFLDAYHLIATSRFFIFSFPSSLAAITTWSWLTSRMFLAVLMALSWLLWKREVRLGKEGKIREHFVYIYSIMLAIGTFIFFIYGSLPHFQFQQYFFKRPFELIPAIIFFITLLGYLQKGIWKTDSFEYSIVMSLIVLVISQVFYISRSAQLFDTLFNIAHILKITSYLILLVGTLQNMASIYRREEESALELRFLNKLGRKLTMHLSLEQVLIEVYKGVHDLIDVNNFYITLNESNNGISTYALKVIDGKIIESKDATGGGISDHIISTKQSILLPNRVLERVNRLGIEVIQLDGERISTSWLGVPILLGDTVLGTMVVLSYLSEKVFNEHHRDLLTTISNQVSIAIQNAMLYEASQAARQAKGMFLANMSHEIRTPLNAILGYSQLLQRDINLSAEQKRYLASIVRSGEHLLTLINDVLEMSKVEANRITISNSTFSLHSLLFDIENMFIERIAKKGLSLEFEYLKEMPNYIHGDESKIRQVLINLLGNAAKFTKKGGIILRAGSVAVNNKGEDFSENNKVILEFEIEDTGVGISKEEIGNLFQAFEQSLSGRESGEGTGLGLAISREYAQLMGGEISVKSILGVGSKFYFKLLANLSSQDDIKEKSALKNVISLKNNQSELRVLVVDDRETNRDLLDKMLTDVGFTTKQATNGLEAIRLNEEWCPHLILMDLVMPIMGGRKAIKRIKQLNTGLVTPIMIAVTASVLENEKDDVLSEGADDFIRKPFRINDLLIKIGEHLNLEYTYEEENDNEENNIAIDEKLLQLKGSLTQTPKKLIDQIQLAIDSLDIDKLEEIIDLIEIITPSEQEFIRKMISKFDFDRLKELFS